MVAVPGDTFGLPIEAAPLGALRIFGRAGGRAIRIESGDHRAALAVERLAGVWWFSSVAVAGAIEAQCLAFLAAARFHVVDGWFDFPASKAGLLVETAKTHLAVRSLPADSIEDAPAPVRVPWDRARCARLGYLVGLGWEAKRIAQDQLIRSTPNNVYRQAHRLGLSLAASSSGAGPLRLPLAIGAVYERAAVRHGLTREAMIRRTVIGAASDPIAAERLLSGC